MLFEKADIPHKFRRQPVPVMLWWSMLGCFVIAMVPASTLLGTIGSALGQLGVMVGMAIFIHRFPPRPLPPSAAQFMWALVLISALALSVSVYSSWQADQLRAHRY